MAFLLRLLEPAMNGTDNFGEVERPTQSHVEGPKPKESSWKNAAASKRVNRNNRTNNSVGSSAKLKSATIPRARSTRTPTSRTWFPDRSPVRLSISSKFWAARCEGDWRAADYFEYSHLSALVKASDRLIL